MYVSKFIFFSNIYEYISFKWKKQQLSTITINLDFLNQLQMTIVQLKNI